MPYLRALADRADGNLSFIASGPAEARDGMALRMDRFLLGNYRANPVFLWAHDYSTIPLGRMAVDMVDGRLKASPEQWRDADFPREVKQAYDDGILHAVSIGWDNVTAGTARRRGYTDVPDDWADDDVCHELLDISAVPVPGDPTALVERQRSALAALVRELATDIPEVAESPETATQGHQNESEHARPFGKDGEYKNFAACVMANQDKDDPEAFCAALEAETAERHVDTGEVEPTRETWEDTAAAMVAVLDPASDDDDKTRRRRYNALLPAYRRAGKVAPEFMTGTDLRALGPDEWRGLWLEGEIDTRVGKVLSARNWERIRAAYEALGEVLEAAAAGAPAETTEDEPEMDAGREAVSPVTPEPELARWARILGKR